MENEIKTEKVKVLRHLVSEQFNYILLLEKEIRSLKTTVIGTKLACKQLSQELVDALAK